jgi:hypothetical protein
VLASISEVENERIIEVYPNPNQGQFTLEMAGLKGEYHLAVVNSLGQTLYSKAADVDNFFETNINVGSVDDGLYFLRIVGQDLNETRRIVVSGR